MECLSWKALSRILREGLSLSLLRGFKKSCTLGGDDGMRSWGQEKREKETASLWVTGPVTE